MHPLIIAALAHGAGGVVTVSGETITSTQTDPDDAYARLKIDDDGNIYKSEDTGVESWVQIDTATNWLRPAGKAPGLYEVRHTSVTGTALDFATAAVDTWHALSGGDYIVYQSVLAPPVSSSTTLTIEIRYNGGAVLSSASYTMAATVNP